MPVAIKRVKDAQGTMSPGLSDPLDAGVREKVKEESLVPVEEVPVGRGGGRLVFCTRSWCLRY